MTYSLVHGITLLEDALLVQEANIESTTETSAVKGMVAGRAQTKHVWTHSDENKGTVKGHGPITITPGVGESGVDGITGGVTIIENAKYGQNIVNPSDWEYTWHHYPHAQEAA